MHSERHLGGIYEVKERKTMEITQDPCHKDISHNMDMEESDIANTSSNAPYRFT